MPFYFMLRRDGAIYHIFGEGTGSKETTDAAYKELAALDVHEIEALVAETERVTSAH
jgi:hypothetical protein